MEFLRGIITTLSEGYDSIENTFTIMHNMADIVCVPYSFTMRNSDGEFESIEVSNVEYDRYRIRVYFGSLEINDGDEIAYAFNIVTGESSNSESYSWEEASRLASIARPIGVQYSEDGVEWLNRAPEETFALRFTHDGGETWGNPVFVGRVIQESNSGSTSSSGSPTPIIPPTGSNSTSSSPTVVPVAIYRPSSITLPVPHDDNGENLLLIIGFCSNEDFFDEDVSNSHSCSNANFTRYICMGDEPQCFKVSSNGQFIDIPGVGLGPAFYGESVVLTIDETMFKWYKPGNTYYARARWVDQSGGFSDWRMFRVTYDAVDMRPVQTEQKYDKTYLDNNVSGNLSIDFSNGRIQTFNAVGDLTISTSDIYGVPFGMDMTIIVKKNMGYSLEITGSTTKTIPNEETGSYIIRVLMLDEIIITISEVI